MRPIDPATEAEEQTRAVGSLVREARQYYRSGDISAAEDFFTVHVPSLVKEPPPPLGSAAGRLSQSGF